MITYSTCTGCGGLLQVTDNIDHHNGEPPCARCGAGLSGDDDEALRQALRNVWPILSVDGRKTAIETAERFKPSA